MTFTASISQITAADFSTSTTDRDRNVWTAGKMRHLINALKGQRVSIILEKATGHGVSDVELVGTSVSPHSSMRTVGVKSFHADGSGGVIWHLLEGIGTVILTDSAARWAALDSYRKDETAAIVIAWDMLRERSGLKPLDLHGKFRVSQWDTFVNVTWEPNTDRHSVREYAGRQHTFKMTPEMVATARSEKEERMAAYRN